MPWEALQGPGNCCPTFHQGFIGLLGVYTMVTQIISEQNLDFFLNWQYLYWIMIQYLCNVDDLEELEDFLSVNCAIRYSYWLWTHCSCWMLFCSLIFIHIWKEANICLLSNASFQNSLDVFGIGNGIQKQSIKQNSFQWDFLLILGQWDRASRLSGGVCMPSSESFTSGQLVTDGWAYTQRFYTKNIF